MGGEENNWPLLHSNTQLVEKIKTKYFCLSEPEKGIEVASLEVSKGGEKNEFGSNCIGRADC